MWRVASRQPITLCRLRLLANSTRNQTLLVDPKKPPGFGRKLAFGLAVTTGVAGAGVVGYAYKDPKFRRCVEHHLPPTKSLFNLIIGSAEARELSNESKSSTSANSTSRSATTSHADIPDFAPYVLIGGGTASYYAALTIRARDPDAVVLIISGEDETPYTRQILSKELWWYGDENVAQNLQYKALSGRIKDVHYEVDGFYPSPKDWPKFPHGCISVLKGLRVEKINTADKSVFLSSGERIRFNKCLIATGSRPKIHKELDRADLKARVHTLHTIKDFKELNSIVGPSKSIAIIGGGLLASEIAYSLKRRFHDLRDLNVYQVFPEDDVLEDVMPVKLCEDASKQLFTHGVRLLNKASIFDASRTKSGGVRLILRKDDGSKHEIIVDHIIDASGSEPNIEVASRSGLEIDKENAGIIVDSGMRARPDVFAAGDVSSYFDLNLGRRRVEHAEHAEITGRVAGENMTGGNRVYPRQASFISAVGNNAHLVGVGRVDPKLRTILVTAQKNPEVNDELRAVTFYADENDRIVGVLMYNVFGDSILMARKILEDKVSAKKAKELARLFRLYPMHKHNNHEHADEEEKKAEMEPHVH